MFTNKNLIFAPLFFIPQTMYFHILRLKFCMNYNPIFHAACPASPLLLGIVTILVQSATCGTLHFMLFCLSVIPALVRPYGPDLVSRLIQNNRGNEFCNEII
jgi:hypothetical protein